MGSAANALIDRLPQRESWMSGRSKCDQCKHELGAADLIPVVSYIALGGRCRYCRKPIPYRNLVVEIFLGTFFVLIFNLQFSIFNQFLIFNVIILQTMAWVSTVIAVMDWETKLVSEAMVILWGVLIFAHKFSIFNFQFSINLLISQLQTDFLGVLVGVVTIGGIWAVTKGKAMGFGDVEIAAVMGLWLGWPKVLVALWTAFVVGGVVGAAKILQRKAKMKSQIAFGPFLIIGTWVAYAWGDMIIQWLFPY